MHAPAGWEELVAEVLGAACGGSAVLGLATIGTNPPPAGCELVRAYIAAADDTPQRREYVAQTLAELGPRSGATALEGLEAAYRSLPPEDYATSWRKVWKPFRVGNLALVQPWREAVLRETDVRFAIEPGASFGSGRHATTRTALRMLQTLCRPGDRVLDAGTGSGILAVAALLLGAERVFGFDLDPRSQQAASELAGANGVQDRARFAAGGFELLERPVEPGGPHLRPGVRPWNGVCANIFHDVLIEHARDLQRALEPGGWFLASGCSLPHRRDVETAFAAAGLVVREVRVRGRWVTFSGLRS